MNDLNHCQGYYRGWDGGLFGSVGEFNEENEEWRLYVEQMEHYLNANGIQDESKKCAVFLLIIGPWAYKHLGSLVGPVSPGAMKYKQAVERIWHSINARNLQLSLKAF